MRRSVVGILIVLTSIGLGVVPLHWFLGATAPFEGTTFDGYSPDRRLTLSRWFEGRRDQLGQAPIQVLCEGFTKDVPAALLGLQVDVAAMLELSHRQTHNGSLGTRLWRALQARFHGVDHAWLTRFDRDAARATLVGLAAIVDRAPVNAALDVVHRRQTRAAAGSRLDVDATLDYIEAHRSIDLAIVPLVMREIPPRIRDDDVIDIDLSSVLSGFETDFRTRAGTRAVNIRIAAKALQGQILGPQEVFSFNQVVGPRTEARGYREAPVIVSDELEPGVGGGVCQVATTLHAAAVLGGLEVLERRSHSRPSGYAPIGLDATVVDGEVDLKFRNPYAVPLAILSSFPERFRLRIELVGLSPPARFDHAISVSKRVEFYRRVTTKSELLPGTFEKKQKGSYGFDVTSTISAKFTDGRVSSRQYRSRYWPVPEVYWVGPDADLAQLPALPDGAAGVMWNGLTVAGTIPADVQERVGKVESQADLSEP